ncbi:MAG TPA: hypothetical protein PKK43_11035, partial [Spirochaetota bacterium]|nr:hypothetical protein [Spirochaetota bacterium]
MDLQNIPAIGVMALCNTSRNYTYKLYNNIITSGYSPVLKGIYVKNDVSTANNCDIVIRNNTIDAGYYTNDELNAVKIDASDTTNCKCDIDNNLMFT